MPTYGYRCEECGHEFEVMQRMSDAPLTTCPNCGSRLRKLLYPVGVQFKGSGFYTTDYKTGANASNGSSSKEPSSSSGSKESSNGSGKSEPAKKTESSKSETSSSSGSSSGDSSKKGD